MEKKSATKIDASKNSQTSQRDQHAPKDPKASTKNSGRTNCTIEKSGPQQQG